MEVKRFEVGKTYYTRSACNYDCIYDMKVLSRTEKTLRVFEGGQEKTLRIKIWDNEEIVKPDGTYSMCPIMRASRDYI